MLTQFLANGSKDLNHSNQVASVHEIDYITFNLDWKTPPPPCFVKDQYIYLKDGIMIRQYSKNIY